MNSGEKLALKYLHSLGIGDIVYQPIINSTPDFLINHSIAVEVSQLFQQDFKTSTELSKKIKKNSLETLERAIYSSIKDVCESFPTDKSKTCHFVEVDLRRPVNEKIKTIRSNCKRILHDFLSGKISVDVRVPITSDGHVKLRILTGSFKSDFRFSMEPVADHDVGGWNERENIDNINFYISNKENTLKENYSKYSEWWLILVHNNMPVLQRFKRSVVIKYIKHNNIFQNILIIDDKAKLLFEINS